MVQEFLPSVRNAILVTPDDSPSSFISDDALPLEVLFHCLPWEEILPMKGTLGFFTHDMITSTATAQLVTKLPEAPCEEQASCEEICYRCGQRLFTSSLTTRVHILNRFTSCQELAQVISFTVVYSYRI